MKILIMSDIHGDFVDYQKIINKESFDRLIVLGDLTSYSMYSNENDDQILNSLSNYRDKLILIKGNCDGYINFDAYNLKSIDVITMHLNNKLVTLTHGNIYSKGFLPECHGEIIFTGHTHIPNISLEENIIYANPGSVGSPRAASSKSYIIFNDEKIIIKDILGNIKKEMNI